MSVYGLATNEANWYMWIQYISGRGADEIALCVLNFIKEKSEEGKRHFLTLPLFTAD